MFLHKSLMLIIMLSPLIIGDSMTTILNSQNIQQMNADDETLTDSTLSFGIKSFTVEVTKPTTKPINTTKSIQLSNNNDDANKNIATDIANLNIYETSSVQPNKNTLTTTSTSAQEQSHTIQSEFSSSTSDIDSDLVKTLTTTIRTPSSLSVSSDTLSSSSTLTLTSKKAINNDNNPIQTGTESEQEQESTDERPPAFPSISPTTINPSNSLEYTMTAKTTTTHEPMINDIHVEKKLENGLYRIKLAEIITDEFNGNEMNTPNTLTTTSRNDHYNNHNVQQQQQQLKNDGSSIGKINIIDLYPSKLEDFGSIIKDSNEKMIRDKQAFLNDDNDDKNTLSNSLNNEFIETAADKNIPTSKIDIELINGNENINNQKSTEQSEKITDLTGKLQEQDGVITEIEEKFRLDDLKPSSSTTSPGQKEIHSKSSSSINQKIEFIDRRVKKSFDFAQNQFGRFSRVDFANTKFNTEPVKKDEKDTNSHQSDKPEFSTTKFYNSKELYNEMIHRKINSEITMKRLTTTPPSVSSLQEIQQKPEEGKETQNKKKYPSYLTRYEVNVDESNINPTHTSSNKDKLKRTMQTIPKIMATKSKMLSLLPSSTKSTKNSNIAVSSSQPTFTIDTLETNKMSTNSNTSEQEAKLQNVELNKTFRKTTANAAGSMSTIMPVSTTTSTTTTTPTQQMTTASMKKMTTTTATIMTSTAVITENVNPTSQQQQQQQQNTEMKVNGNTSTTPKSGKPFSRPRLLTRLQEKINSLECDIQNLPQDSHLWRGNETHELLLPITTPADCKTNEDCSPMIISWEGQATIQSGDVLLVEINDSLLTPIDYNQTQNNITHKATTTVYQVTRLGHEHCDVTEGGLLDITPLVVDGKKIVTLYDKDLTEGINLLIVVSELWGSQCVRLKVTVKSDNCGDNADCSGKGVCFSNVSMDGYECQCCQGFAGPHCEEIDACLPSPCTNNGICVDLSQGHEGNAYQCLCPYGYTGKNCQYESDPCNPTECLNGGSCVGNSTHFRCDCAPGYTGPLCQHNLNECESSPCVHGICVDQEDGFRCFCQPGFAGDLCNFEYNECESNPCANGGQCIDQIGGYECKCTRGYTGSQCHIKVDFCANGPCPEGHRCIDHGDEFTCECPSGTNGPDCIQVPRTLCNVNPCSNGGTCWTIEDSFYCACRPGYTGKMCEDEFVVETVVSSSEFMVDDTNAIRGIGFGDKAFGVAVSKSPIELHNAYIAAGTLAAAIFIVAVVVTICHCKVNQTYRRFSTRHHQLIPILGFGRRMKSPKSHRHWLSGKSGGGSGGGGGSNGNLVGAKTNKGHLPGTGTTQCHNHHLTGNNGNNANGNYLHHHPHQIPDRPFQRHLAMNLENDMYYTVDFSESQHSPLIQ